MGDWPLSGDCPQAIYYPTGTGYSVSVADHATHDVEGAWVEVIASTPYDAFVIPIIHGISAAVNTLVDIGVGPAGSEVVIVKNINYSYPTTSSALWLKNFPTPLVVPKGSRIAARAQGTGAGAENIYIGIMLIQKGGFQMIPPAGVSDTYGDATADSGGTAVDPGGSADTKGAWTVLTASLTRDITSLFFTIGSGNTAMTACYWAIDIGIGPAGSEVVVVADYPAATHANTNCIMDRASPLFPINLKAGTAVSIRAACSITDATDRLFDAVLYTFS